MSDSGYEGAEQALDEQLTELVEIEQTLDQVEDFEYIRDRLERWHQRTIQLIAARISTDEAKKFSTYTIKMSFITAIEPIAQFNNLQENIGRYRSRLASLREEIRNPKNRFFEAKEPNSTADIKGQSAHSNPTDESRLLNDDQKKGLALVEPAGKDVASRVGGGSVEASSTSVQLAFPDKVTRAWLREHVPMSFWLWLAGVLMAAFLLGATVGQTTLVRELISKKSDGSTSQPAISSDDIKNKVDELTQAHIATSLITSVSL